MTVIMGLCGVLTLLSASGVVFSKKSLHSALALVATLFFVAVHFALLGADFLAALQVLVYAGAIMILVVFVIMLLGIEHDADASRAISIPAYLGGIFAIVFAVALVTIVSNPSFVDLFDASETIQPLESTAQTVGIVLLTDHVLAFEITAVLLFAAILGAVLLAYQPPRPLKAGRGLKAVRDKFASDSARSAVMTGSSVMGEEG